MFFGNVRAIGFVNLFARSGAIQSGKCRTLPAPRPSKTSFVDCEAPGRRFRPRYRIGSSHQWAQFCARPFWVLAGRQAIFHSGGRAGVTTMCDAQPIDIVHVCPGHSESYRFWRTPSGMTGVRGAVIDHGGARSITRFRSLFNTLQRAAWGVRAKSRSAVNVARIRRRSGGASGPCVGGKVSWRLSTEGAQPDGAMAASRATGVLAGEIEARPRTGRQIVCGVGRSRLRQAECALARLGGLIAGLG